MVVTFVPARIDADSAGAPSRSAASDKPRIVPNDSVLGHMSLPKVAKPWSAVPVCGLIAQYNATGPAPGPNLLPATMREVLNKSLTLRGYINYEFAAEHYPAFLRTATAAVADGRIRYREDITDGLEKAPAAFISMLKGRNFGKALVRVTPSA
jgi:NADPH-dependent curcumin reductase CurA